MQYINSIHQNFNMSKRISNIKTKLVEFVWDLFVKIN